METINPTSIQPVLPAEIIDRIIDCALKSELRVLEDRARGLNTSLRIPSQSTPVKVFGVTDSPTSTEHQYANVAFNFAAVNKTFLKRTLHNVSGHLHGARRRDRVTQPKLKYSWMRRSTLEESEIVHKLAKVKKALKPLKPMVQKVKVKVEIEPSPMEELL